MVVLAIGLILAAFAIPTMVRTLDAYHTRGTMTNIVGLVQRCRVQGIKHDNSEGILLDTVGGQTRLYCKDISAIASAVQTSDPQIILMPEFSLAPAPTGTNPTPLNALTMWGANFTQIGVDTAPFFNSRGLPCTAPVAGGACTQISGYVSYFTYTGRSTRWAAISISPAGRIQTWFWNGNSWGN